MAAFTRLVLFTLLGFLIACGEPPRTFNVLLIGLDTLRADHLGCYGYDRNVSPEIDRLAEQGVPFKSALSQSPWTLPSFATVFTSLYPTQHGAVSTTSAMGSSFPTLATMLQARGYATGAVVNTTVLEPDYAVNRGFDHYDCAPLETRHADGTTRDVLEWIGRHSDGPFLAFAHYYDSHLPYSPPAPYDTLFRGDYAGPIGNSVELEQFPHDVGGYSPVLKALSSADWDRIKSLYDGEIAFMDREVGKLIKGIEDLKLRETTLIVLLSDHGEEFFEHGGFAHGHSLFTELLAVPLIFSLPGVLPEGASISRQVRLVDVMPTILDVLGIEAQEHFEGVSLLHLMRAGAGSGAPATGVLPADRAYGEALLHRPEMKSITAYPWKLICSDEIGHPRLFSLDSDPLELSPVTDTGHPMTIELQDMLTRTQFSLSDTWFVELSGGGDSHVFDLLVTAPGSPKSDGITLPRFLDEEGNLIRSDRIVPAEISYRTIHLKELQLEGTVTLAFKVGPDYVRVNFDLAIDGAPALKEAFLGEALSSPPGMPFVQSRRKGKLSQGIPSSRPEAPYFVVWHPGQEFKEARQIKRSKKMKEELRSLGYIQ